MRHAFHHEGVLQIDHHQGSPRRIEVFIDMLATPTRHDPIDDRRWNDDLMHD
jgi:hypothetical protein